MTLLFHKTSDTFYNHHTFLSATKDFNKRESAVSDNALKVLNFQVHL